MTASSERSQAIQDASWNYELAQPKVPPGSAEEELALQDIDAARAAEERELQDTPEARAHRHARAMRRQATRR